MRIRKGDLVQVVAGKDKGATGKVLQSFPDDERVLVEGVNRITKHVRDPRRQRGAQSGGLVVQEAPLHVSNVMLVDPEDQRPTRVGVRRDESGRPVRYSRRTGKEL